MQFLCSWYYQHSPHRYQFLKIIWPWNVGSSSPISRVNKFSPYQRDKSGRLSSYHTHTLTTTHVPPTLFRPAPALIPLPPHDMLMLPLSILVTLTKLLPPPVLPPPLPLGEFWTLHRPLTIFSGTFRRISLIYLPS